MCGIAGAWLSRGDARAPVRRMCERMRLRGPDAAGEWADPELGVVLGHRRLAIIDVDPRANQPFASADGRDQIVFNGEIYNYRELRAELEAEGAPLRTQSDTEVILELYRRRGVAAFQRLRGMFALAIWDAGAQQLVLARDPYGIKPLYVARTEAGWLFASQVKALLESGAVSRTVDPAGVAGFYIWGSVPEPFTLYEAIRPVPSGSVMLIGRDGACRTEAYADIAAAWQGREASPPDLAERVREAMASAVTAHLVADVPVAVLLSGGVDSGAIAGLTAEQGHRIEGVTVAFPEFAGGWLDETPRARAVAATYGLPHTVREVGQAEFQADIPAILDAMDQPTVDGVNTWFASKAIAERGYKVALSGVGGDELFCGYDTFRSAPRIRRLARLLGGDGPLRAPVGAVLAAAARAAGRPKLGSLARFGATLEGAYMVRRGLVMPDGLAALMGPEVAREGLRRLDEAATSLPPAADEAGAVAALESTRYLRNQLLRDTDWASMAHSLELRTPLVDFTLLSALAPYASAFMNGHGKALLAQAPRQPLPDQVLNHRKTGFSLPMQAWLVGSCPGAGAQPIASAGAPWVAQWATAVGSAFGFAS